MNNCNSMKYIYIYIYFKKYNKNVPNISSIKAVCEETVTI